MVVFGNEDDLPHKDFKIKQTYKLDNGNTILIENTGMKTVKTKAIEKDYFLKILISDYSNEVYQEEKEKTKKKILQKTDTNKSGL